MVKSRVPLAVQGRHICTTLQQVVDDACRPVACGVVQWREAMAVAGTDQLLAPRVAKIWNATILGKSLTCGSEKRSTVFYAMPLWHLLLQLHTNMMPRYQIFSLGWLVGGRLVGRGMAGWGWGGVIMSDCINNNKIKLASSKRHLTHSSDFALQFITKCDNELSQISQTLAVAPFALKTVRFTKRIQTPLLFNWSSHSNMTNEVSEP